jgi:hypothetical protein
LILIVHQGEVFVNDIIAFENVRGRFVLKVAFLDGLGRSPVFLQTGQSQPEADDDFFLLA